MRFTLFFIRLHFWANLRGKGYEEANRAVYM